MFGFASRATIIENNRSNLETWATAADKSRLQGTWTATVAERNGRPAPEILGNQITFRGDEFVIRNRDGQRLYEGTFRKDPTQQPTAIDFRHLTGSMRGRIWLGIFHREGDMLKISDNAADPNQPRPTRFNEARGYVNIIFQRDRTNDRV